jgi:RAB protein geranylgeranyltransferase component A
MIAYVICNYGYNLTRPIPPFAAADYAVEGMIERFGRFVRSCGIYGESPYLYVDNGIGDIPQAFSRIASIFGSIFILHPKVELNEMRI